MANFTKDDAAHLLRRIGFGGSPSDIASLASLGRQGAVDSLLNYGETDNSALDSLIERSFQFSDPSNAAVFNSAELQRWWYTRMVFTARPFEEKMTLFWHNHFATAVSKVPEIFMYIQNNMLRANALGRFDDLLLKVAQDPAMLIWLDGVTSVKGVPNENFARELQELFTMGINDVVTGEQNYTEDDVKQVARAFTGWRFYQPDPSKPFDFTFVVDPSEHDYGAKTIYGTTANYEGADVLTLIAARRATARFLVTKLFNYFVYPVGPKGSDQQTIEKYADVYMNSGHSIKQLVRAIFTSDEFFNDRARFGLVKSPAEYIVGAIRMLGATYNPGTAAPDGNAEILVYLSILIGQELFNPPNVAGWPGGMDWINTATLLNRYTYADYLSVIRPDNQPGVWIPPSVLQKYSKPNPQKTVKKFLSLLGPLAVDDAVKANLASYLQTDDNGQPAPFQATAAEIDKKTRGLVHQIMCLPEFQLN